MTCARRARVGRRPRQRPCLVSDLLLRPQPWDEPGHNQRSAASVLGGSLAPPKAVAIEESLNRWLENWLVVRRVLPPTRDDEALLPKIREVALNCLKGTIEAHRMKVYLMRMACKPADHGAFPPSKRRNQPRRLPPSMTLPSLTEPNDAKAMAVSLDCSCPPGSRSGSRPEPGSRCLAATVRSDRPAIATTAPSPVQGVWASPCPCS